MAWECPAPLRPVLPVALALANPRGTLPSFLCLSGSFPASGSQKKCHLLREALPLDGARSSGNLAMESQPLLCSVLHFPQYLGIVKILGAPSRRGRTPVLCAGGSLVLCTALGTSSCSIQICRQINEGGNRLSTMSYLTRSLLTPALVMMTVLSTMAIGAY